MQIKSLKCTLGLLSVSQGYQRRAIGIGSKILGGLDYLYLVQTIYNTGVKTQVPNVVANVLSEIFL